MLKLYKEFFYIPKFGKIREKVMVARIALSISIVLFCLVAMSLTAYAYFTSGIVAGSNMIRAAKFETAVKVQITDASGNPLEEGQITPITSDRKNYAIDGMEVGKWYYVTVTPTERSTAKTGFIIVSAEGGNMTYHTQQLGVDLNAPEGHTDQLRFKVMITDSTRVILKSHWGTSSFYPDYQLNNENDERYITQEESIKLVVNGVQEPPASTDPGTSTTPEQSGGATEPTTPENEATQPTTPENEATTPAATQPAETTEPTAATEAAQQETVPAATESNA